MADRETIIDPDNGTGTDYLSMDAWEDAFGGVGNSGDCTGEGERAVGVLRCTGGSDDAASVVIFAGWTSTDPVNYPMVIAKQEEGYRHIGQWPTTENIYRLWKGGGESAIQLQMPYCRLIGVAVRDATLSFKGTIEIEEEGCTVESCLVWSGRSGASEAYGIYAKSFTGTGLPTKIGNNIVIGFDGIQVGGSAGIFCSTVSDSICYIYYNTVVGCYRGIAAGAVSRAVTNNLVYDSTIAFHNISGTWNGSNNGYDNGSDPNTGGTDLSGVAGADIFLDYAAADYRMAGDSVVVDQGVTLAADPDYPITKDWEDEDRRGVGPALGFDDFPAPLDPGPTAYEQLQERVCRWSLEGSMNSPDTYHPTS